MKSKFTYHTEDEEIQRSVELFADAWKNNVPEFAVQTSGSTGVPKTIVLKREQLRASAQRTLRFFDISAGTSALLGISPETIGGKMMIVRALEGDLHLRITHPSDDPLQSIPIAQTPDFCPLVPMQVLRIAERSPQQLNHIQTILLGGSPLPASMENRLKNLHERCFLGFGMTETVSHIAVRKMGNPVYTALKGVHLAENDGNLVISDEELGIRGLVTNDSVELIDSTHFRWLGRSDFAINSGGIKIHPESLERVLSEIVHIPFFIASEPDDTFGEKCIMIADDHGSIPSENEIRLWCRKHAGSYTAPRAIYRTSVVFNRGGKINRRATLQQLGLVR